MRYRTVRQVLLELHRRGGSLEIIRETERPEYAPHLTQDETGWPHGLWIRPELLDWANQHLPMINRINNTICFLVVAAVFAMIGIEAGNQPGMTHSGTQQVEVRR